MWIPGDSSPSMQCLYMLYVSILSESKNSNVPCFILEMQERGEAVCFEENSVSEEIVLVWQALMLASRA